MAYSSNTISVADAFGFGTEEEDEEEDEPAAEDRSSEDRSDESSSSRASRCRSSRTLATNSRAARSSAATSSGAGGLANVDPGLSRKYPATRARRAASHPRNDATSLVAAANNASRFVSPKSEQVDDDASQPQPPASSPPAPASSPSSSPAGPPATSPLFLARRSRLDALRATCSARIFELSADTAILEGIAATSRAADPRSVARTSSERTIAPAASARANSNASALTRRASSSGTSRRTHRFIASDVDDRARNFSGSRVANVDRCRATAAGKKPSEVRSNARSTARKMASRSASGTRDVSGEDDADVSEASSSSSDASERFASLAARFSSPPPRRTASEAKSCVDASNPSKSVSPHSNPSVSGSARVTASNTARWSPVRTRPFPVRMSLQYIFSDRDNAPLVANTASSSSSRFAFESESEREDDEFEVADDADVNVNRGSARVIPLFTATTASAISLAGAPRRSAHVAVAAAARHNS